MNIILEIIRNLFPGKIRLLWLRARYGDEVSLAASVGRSIILARKLKLGAGSRIGNGNYIGPLNAFVMGECATMGNLNWIAIARKHDLGGKGALCLKPRSAITHRHYIDCQGLVSVGEMTIVAGVRSTLWTHKINIKESRQTVGDIIIGDYCYLGSNIVVVGPTVIPSRSVVAPGAVVSAAFGEDLVLLGGCPAKVLKHYSGAEMFFSRETPYVQ